MLENVDELKVLEKHCLEHHCGMLGNVGSMLENVEGFFTSCWRDVGKCWRAESTGKARPSKQSTVSGIPGTPGSSPTIKAPKPIQFLVFPNARNAEQFRHLGNHGKALPRTPLWHVGKCWKHVEKCWRLFYVMLTRCWKMLTSSRYWKSIACQAIHGVRHPGYSRKLPNN